MKKVHLKSKTIHGLTTRTKNEDEMNPQTQKIAPLWGRFFTEIIPTLTPETKSYGVYSNYESDAFGEFDVMVGVDNTADTELKTVKLAEGDYLCFEVKGELPQAVIVTWGEVWGYFADENCKEKRAFKTDFELYLSESEAEIYIGIV
jgi:predicted transcriptional regulator YdeE